MASLDINEVARRSGIPASALRYYEERGLIASTGRSGLRRVFGPDVIDRLALISLGSAAGLSLEEIGRMFMPDGRARVDRGLLSAKADELDRKIRRLCAVRDGLRHASSCRAPDHLECPTFRRLMEVALGSAARSRRKGPKRTTR